MAKKKTTRPNEPPRWQSCPLKIWMKIFRLAGSGPSEVFDTSPIDPTSSGKRAWSHEPPVPVSHIMAVIYPDSISMRDLREYKTRAKTRSSLSLVSKYWHKMVQPILYEYVVLDTEAKMLSFTRAVGRDWERALAEDPNALPQTATHVGCLTKHLRIDLSDAVWKAEKTEKWAKPVKAAFVKAFRLCTKVEVLNVIPFYNSGYPGSMPDELRHEILQNGCQLRSITAFGCSSSLLEAMTLQAETLEALTLSILSRSTEPQYNGLLFRRTTSLDCTR